jgi:hypothetical protein
MQFARFCRVFCTVFAAGKHAANATCTRPDGCHFFAFALILIKYTFYLPIKRRIYICAVMQNNEYLFLYRQNLNKKFLRLNTALKRDNAKRFFFKSVVTGFFLP